MPRWSWAPVALVVGVASAAIVGACEAPRPLAPAVAAMEARQRLKVEESARVLFPSILEPSGPPMQVFLIADASLQVYRVSLTTLNYLGQAGPRPHKAIDGLDLKRVLPSFDPGHDAWMVVDPEALRGLVRDNVRVIWIHHEPERGDSIVDERTQAH